MRLQQPVRIDTLLLATVTEVPAWHPEHDRFEAFPVHAFLIHHPGGAIVVDTGIGFDNSLIEEMYKPDSHRLVDALHANGVDERDVAMVVNSHLHFDHCGQNHTVNAPIVVQQSELAAATAPHYTVPEWAVVPAHRALLLDGDAEIADGVRVIHTPGHTPGHQSVMIECGDARVLIAAQCIFRGSAWGNEVEGAGVETANLHAPEWAAAAQTSLERLRSMRPTSVLFSHDAPLAALAW